jgi:hypothetical protein
VNNDLKSDSYEAVVYVGGRGAEIDLPEHGRSIKLVEEVCTATSCQRTLSYTFSSFTGRGN